MISIIAMRVKPNSKTNSVKKTADGYVVHTKARAIDGKANGAVVKLLAESFGVPKTRVRLVRGRTTRHKIFEIL